MKKWLVAAILLYALPLIAQTYEYTDDSGTVNFTEDLGKVPKKYRKKARPVVTEESGPQLSEEAPAAQQKGEPKGRTAETKGEKNAYGGKDEREWRADFGSAGAELKAAEQDVRELQARLADTTRMTRTEYLTVQNSLKHAEFRRQELAKKWQALNAKADQAGVPAELRQ